MKNQNKRWLAHVRKVQSSFPFLDKPGTVIKLKNGEGRLHSQNEPAYQSYTTVGYYEDGRKHGVQATRFGTKVYYYKGVLVPPRFIRQPKKLTFEDIISNPNTEIRRIGCEIYGYQRMLDEKKFDIIHQDDDKDMLLLKTTLPSEEVVTLIRVVDGTHNSGPDKEIYFLQVPPDMTTCQQAVAWTFKMEPDEYAPLVET